MLLICNSQAQTEQSDHMLTWMGYNPSYWMGQAQESPRAHNRRDAGSEMSYASWAGIQNS